MLWHQGTPMAPRSPTSREFPVEPTFLDEAEERMRNVLSALVHAPGDAGSLVAPTEDTRSAKQRARERLRNNPSEAVAGRLAKLKIRPNADAIGGFRTTPKVPVDPRNSLADVDVVDGLERIIGRNELVGVWYLDSGLEAARSVGRILVLGPGGNLIPKGTGFMISPRLLITNNHVLGTEDRATGAVIEFNFQNDSRGEPRRSVPFKLDPASCFVTSPKNQLDYTVVAVRDSEDGGLAGFGFKRLAAIANEILDGECVTIVQHPNGEPKQIALRENYVLQLPETGAHFLHYQTDTTPGSSGSPVYNDEWDVVALHHAGLPRKDSQGRVLTPEGEVWRLSMGEHRIHWIANEGIRVAAILEDLRSRTDLGEMARGLLEAVLSGGGSEPATPESRRPAVGTVSVRKPAEAPPATPGATSSPTLTVSGSVATWTIPFQISVSLGLPATVGGIAPAAPTLTPAVSQDPAMAEARAAFEAGAARPYYDEAADIQARDAYYADLAEGLDPVQFYGALRSLLETTHVNRPSYKPSTHLYPWIDLRPNRKIQSVYSGLQFEPLELIAHDLEMDRLREESLARLTASESLDEAGLEALANRLEAALMYNCEHVVPQSWFRKREPMRGDLHHLFACESNCNSFRGNHPYFDFSDFDEAIRTDCGKLEDNRFEPGRGKGLVARATLYFLLRYPAQIDATPNEYTVDRIATLLAWHADEPPEEYELHRNQAIFAKQGNRNPLIDHPDWASLIDFAQGLG